MPPTKAGVDSRAAQLIGFPRKFMVRGQVRMLNTTEYNAVHFICCCVMDGKGRMMEDRRRDTE